ncbi:uncharacterized protein LOC111247026 [Varroa destructor]|uniref:Uncharacterized protein n=1 Tax=Varroa destructor TaxID=109461 RepID=A0A7M7JJT8_VARDE|nr:uncharacterized protein LOC111247026 [Varroa destructor]
MDIVSVVSGNLQKEALGVGLRFATDGGDGRRMVCHRKECLSGRYIYSVLESRLFLDLEVPKAGATSVLTGFCQGVAHIGQRRIFSNHHLLAVPLSKSCYFSAMKDSNATMDADEGRPMRCVEVTKNYGWKRQKKDLRTLKSVELIYLGSKFDPAKRQKDLLHSMDSCCAFYLFPKSGGSASSLFWR